MSGFDEEFIKEAEGYDVLGPAYFDSRSVVNKFMQKFEIEQFKPLADKISEEIRDKIWNDLQDYLLSDTECNLKGELHRMVDKCVYEILNGSSWALKKYALDDRHDNEKVREVVAKLIPKELQDARIADLEKENERLQKDLNWYRSMR